MAAATDGEGASPSSTGGGVGAAVRCLGRAGRRVGSRLGFDLKLAASPALVLLCQPVCGLSLASCSAGWRSNGGASSGSGETLDRRCRS